MLAAVFTANFASIVDVLLLLGMGLGIQLAQSRVCSIIVLVYSIINLIISIFATGRVTGWLIIVAGILAVIYTFKFQKAWKEYQQTGMISA